MAERVRIYIHDTARAGQQEQAKALGLLLGDAAQIEALKFPIEPIPDAIRTAVVFGGDGSNRSVTQAMMRRDEPGVVVATKGGSQNAFHASLAHEGSTVNPDDIADAHTDDSIRPFHPATLNEHVFCSVAETGRVAKPWSLRNESYRGTIIPRGARMLIAAVQTAIAEAGHDTEESLARVFITSGHFQSIELFPGQSLYSEEIVSVTAPPMSKREMTQAAWGVVKGLATRKPFPTDFFVIERDTEFVLPDTGLKSISLGGDVFPVHDGTITVRRADKAVAATALILPTVGQRPRRFRSR